jgi:transposase
MLWIDRTGSPWRDLPEKYGPWRTVASRFYRWQKAGVWDRILRALQSQISQDAAKLETVTNPRLFATPYRTTQPKLFALDALGEGGWLKALRLAGYAARARRRPEALQQALFPYLEAL